MDWQTLVTSLLGGGGGAAVIGYGIMRKIKADMATDTADSKARNIQDQMLNRMRKMMRDSDEDHERRYERLKAEYLEFRGKVEREFGHVQKFNRDTQSDIRKLARAGSVPEQDLDTQIYRTGMGPLDP